MASLAEPPGWQRMAPPPFMVYSHRLWLEPGPGQEWDQDKWVVRTFHTPPEQGQGRTPGTFSGPEEWGLVPIFQVLKMFPVMNTSVLPCPCSGAV